jgi:hypothetical protein
MGPNAPMVAISLLNLVMWGATVILHTILHNQAAFLPKNLLKTPYSFLKGVKQCLLLVVVLTSFYRDSKIVGYIF